MIGQTVAALAVLWSDHRRRIGRNRDAAEPTPPTHSRVLASTCLLPGNLTGTRTTSLHDKVNGCVSHPLSLSPPPTPLLRPCRPHITTRWRAARRFSRGPASRFMPGTTHIAPAAGQCLILALEGLSTNQVTHGTVYAQQADRSWDASTASRAPPRPSWRQARALPRPPCPVSALDGLARPHSLTWPAVLPRPLGPPAWAVTDDTRRPRHPIRRMRLVPPLPDVSPAGFPDVYCRKSGRALLTHFATCVPVIGSSPPVLVASTHGLLASVFPWLIHSPNTSLDLFRLTPSCPCGTYLWRSPAAFTTLHKYPLPVPLCPLRRLSVCIWLTTGPGRTICPSTRPHPPQTQAHTTLYLAQRWHHLIADTGSYKPVSGSTLPLRKLTYAAGYGLYHPTATNR